MKGKIYALLCCMMLMLSCPTGAASAETTTPVQEIVQETEEEEPSKAMKIVQFLAIFTVAMGVTAYIVVRPKLKLLKEAKKK
ncbi:MAG: hypothetical protein IJ512_05700 [Ruminococcus sp.]|nr:hypothetical protein [Ruminococcus sp.]